MLRNFPVIQEERQVGLLQSIRFDSARKRVCALVVSCGMRGKCVVPAQRVRMIADGFILIDGMEKYRRTDQQETWPFIRDTSGLLIGRIVDYAIDKRTMEVYAIECIQGYWFSDCTCRVWIYEYTSMNVPDECIVPDILSSKPIFSREGNGE